ncbi:hypothetical protein D9M69_709330 [compost metagenome]
MRSAWRGKAGGVAQGDDDGRGSVAKGAGYTEAARCQLAEGGSGIAFGNLQDGCGAVHGRREGQAEEQGEGACKLDVHVGVFQRGCVLGQPAKQSELCRFRVDCAGLKRAGIVRPYFTCG